jgi:hypothetical protein
MAKSYRVIGAPAGKAARTLKAALQEAEVSGILSVPVDEIRLRLPVSEVRMVTEERADDRRDR